MTVVASSSTASASVWADRANSDQFRPIQRRTPGKLPSPTRGGSGWRGCCGSIGCWGIHESAGRDVDVDAAAPHLAPIHTAQTRRLGKEGLDALKLRLTEPEHTVHPPCCRSLGDFPRPRGTLFSLYCHPPRRNWLVMLPSGEGSTSEASLMQLPINIQCRVGGVAGYEIHREPARLVLCIGISALGEAAADIRRRCLPEKLPGIPVPTIQAGNSGARCQQQGASSQ